MELTPTQYVDTKLAASIDILANDLVILLRDPATTNEAAIRSLKGALLAMLYQGRDAMTRAALEAQEARLAAAPCACQQSPTALLAGTHFVNCWKVTSGSI